MSLEAGRKLGPYEVLSQIGKGGMGEVYRARDTKLHRNVAVKVLAEEFAGDDERLARFEREAKLLASLNHPNIVHIYEIGEHEGTPYIAMEYVEGETLRELLPGEPLPTKKLLKLSIQIADGLAKAHGAGIVHRDLKPENLMVTQDGLVKILDFGLAKMFLSPSAGGSEAKTVTKATQEGAVLGTVQYMSPEQAAGRPVDYRSDQFSLGAILYEMATGEIAFLRETMPEMQAAIIRDVPKPMSVVKPDVPAQLVRLIGRCLEKEPGKRYGSTRDVVAELEGVNGSSGGERGSRRFLLVSVLGLGLMTMLVALAAVLTGDVRDWLADSESRPPIKSIVVLPLQNLSGDPEQEYFADGMTGALIADLARIGALKVISRTSAMRYKETDKPLPEIARELNVDAVIEGSAMRAGNRVRITVQLVHAATDHSLWADSYQRDVQDVLALQGEVSQSIAREVAAVLMPEERARLTNRRRVDPDAYEDYLRGRVYASRVPEGLETAAEFFRRAIDRDPEYALAWAGLAQTRYGLAVFGLAPPSDSYAAGKVEASKALELDDTLGEAHIALGDIAFLEWDWAAAQREYERALQLDSNSADAHRGYAHSFVVRGLTERSVAEARNAWELDPLSVGMNALVADVLYLAGKYDDAVERCLRALEMDPDASLIHWQLWRSFHQKGMYADAVAAYAKYVHPEYLSASRDPADNLASRFEESGYQAVMLEGAQALEDQWQARSDPLTIALSYFTATRIEDGFLWLERAYGRRDPALPLLLRTDRMLDRVRDDPRFQDLVRRMNFPD